MNALSNKKNETIFSIGIFLMLILCIFLGGCVTVDGTTQSPIRFGYGVRVAPGIQIKDGNSSAHLVAGYSRIAFTGGSGRNDIFHAGLQFRHGLSKKSPEGFWIGAESAYLFFNNRFDNSSTKQTASGFTIGAMAGYRFLVGKVPMSVYLAPAYSRLGKFKTNGTTGGAASNGFYGRFGVDLHLMSLLTKKGR